MPSINGVIIPSITFYNDKYEIYQQINAALFRHIVLNGANAILMFSSVEEEEIFSKNANQEIELINLAYKTVGDKIPLIMGIRGNEVESIISQIDDMGKKFDKLSFIIAPPFSEKVSLDELESHFENILSSLTTENNIYLYNNPPQVAGNEIKPEITKNLIQFSKLKGILDAADKISVYKANSQFLNENFGVYCSNVAKFATFLQIIPLELRKYAGIVSSMGNLVNVCAKLYKASLEDNILDVLVLQELIDDIRAKIYFKFEKGHKYYGVMYAFLYLYKNLLGIGLEEYLKNLDNASKNIIEATVNYMLNQKQIHQLYSLDKDQLFQLDEIINLFSDIPILNEQGNIKKILGPLDGTFNKIYRVNFENSECIFRFRTSKTFQYEQIIKEKLLFPLLGGISPTFFKKIEEIIVTPKGSYIFDKKHPPIIPVANLIYYSETKQKIPYNFAIMDYIHGKSLNILIEQYLKENRSITTSKFLNLFENLGDILAKLHEVKFDSFYKKITHIGTKEKKKWVEIFNSELEAELEKAKKNKINFFNDIMDYFSDISPLIEDEIEPVLLHNDFQANNIIIKDEMGAIQINGIIDFDNWRVGPRAIDFVKFNYWLNQYLNKFELHDIFKKGYSNYNNYKFNNDFNKKIEIYTLLWLIKNYNIEINKKAKTEHDKTSADVYLYEIKKIVIP